MIHAPIPVSQLAFELGFDDPACFCRFKVQTPDRTFSERLPGAGATEVVSPKPKRPESRFG
jgi:hypothetical protein